jgi:hypothetical protein
VSRCRLMMVFFLLFAALPVSVFASQWQIEAPLVTNKPGIVEVPLLPELHIPDQEGLDIRVMGPDDKPRAFELYWREDRGTATITLERDSARLDNQIFIWTAKVPEKDRINVKALSISILANDYIGKVDIYGLRNGKWIKLVEKVALFAAAEYQKAFTQGEIKVEEAIYEGFRLEFTAYAKKPVPISTVQIRGERLGKDYTDVPIPLKFQRKEGKDANGRGTVELTSILPGAGLFVKELEMVSAAQFNGDWCLERQGISGGKRTYIPVLQGNLVGIGKGSTSLKIDVGQWWIDSEMNLKLLSADGYLGEVRELKLIVRVPRLVFLADIAGEYLVQAGAGNRMQILQIPSAKRGEVLADIRFGASKINQGWRPESLVAQYRLGGASFKADGYEWNSGIRVAGPGYHRFVLHQRASLEDNLQGLRIVRNNTQIPYFMEKGEIKETVLKSDESYNKDKNITTWHVELPQASSRWIGLKLKARGIFNRTLIVERDQPKPVKGVVWERISWVNDSQKPSELFITLAGFPKEEIKLRLVMAHGNNTPVRLEEVKALYEAPIVYFLADAGEGYALYGGNRSAQTPSYDIGVIQGRLMDQVPQEAILSADKPLKDRPVTSFIMSYFSKNNWGLYIVLGILTAGLMAVIAYLFPRAKA